MENFKQTPTLDVYRDAEVYLLHHRWILLNLVTSNNKLMNFKLILQRQKKE